MGDRILFPILMNSNDGRDIVYPQIVKYYKDLNAKTIFLLTDEEDREYYYDNIELDKLDIELFYLGPTEAEKCETQLILV